VKTTGILLAAALLACVNTAVAGVLAEVGKEVAKEVAVELTKAAIAQLADAWKSQAASSNDRKRAESLVLSLIDESVPMTTRLNLYAPTVDYFSHGVLSPTGLLQREVTAQKQWPYRQYKLLKLDDVDIHPSREYAAITYTVSFLLMRGNEKREGTSKIALLVGSFSTSPRIHAIKGWTNSPENKIESGTYLEAFYGSKSGGPAQHDQLFSSLSADPRLAGVAIRCIQGNSRTADTGRDETVAERRVPPVVTRQCKGSGWLLIGPIGPEKAEELREYLQENFVHLYGGVLRY
jgi:hypothetical protein